MAYAQEKKMLISQIINIGDSAMKTRFPIIVLLVLTLLLTSCNQGTLPPTTQAASPTETMPVAAEPSATLVPTAVILPTQPAGEASEEISLDYSLVAQGVSIESVPAQTANAGDPYWVGAPQYRLLTLEGYPISKHKTAAQIIVYPANELASANKNMGQVAEDLQNLLQTQQAGDQLPMLPLLQGEKQILNTQVQYLDFQDGRGVRYLTQIGNGIAPINNFELFYTFQGLTSDKQSYVAVQLPINNPELPAGPEMSEQMIADITNDPGYYMNYLSSTKTMLNQQSADSFVPDLSTLDSVVESLQIPPTPSTTPTPEIFMPAPLEGVLADKTRQDLAMRTGVDLAMISVVEISQQDWPDICLGLAPQGNQECTKTNVPGWRIVLNAAGHTHEYRTTEDGNKVAYSGPVIVAGPVECQIDGSSQVYSPEDGYCFAYPVRFHRTDENGPIAIYGPAYGNGPDPLFVSLTVEISSLGAGQNLDNAVNTFLSQLGVVPMPQTRLMIEVANEPAIMLEVVPGMLGSRDVFLVHNQKLFHFMFWPAPSLVSETAPDVEDLYQTVLGSLYFSN
jgi:hypothetical protein